MNQKYTVFAGCSYTEGVGLPGTSCNPNLWCNILYNTSQSLSKTRLINLGSGGSTNLEIFQQSIQAVTKYDCNYLFVAWTSLYRYKFSLGVELYNVQQYWSAAQTPVESTVNPGITYSTEYLTDVKNKFFSMHHDHYEIVKILNYTALINQLCQRLGVEVYFINNMLPWDSQYFNHIKEKGRLPSHTTPYTQNLLGIDTRDDEEFFKIYDQIHQEYADTQGVTQCNWLNIDRSFAQQIIDIGNDGMHPGTLSHYQFGHCLTESFEKISMTQGSS